MNIRLAPHPVFQYTFHCWFDKTRVATIQQNWNGAIAPADATYYVLWNTLVVPQHLRINRSMHLEDIDQFIKDKHGELKMVR